MNDILVLLLRRLRRPLIALIGAYAFSIIGLVLMPGVDDKGLRWHLSLFDAFYVMSYTATTIGFGEVPHAFSYAQRLWLAISIYVSVIAWAYTIGSIFALTQQPEFRQAWARRRFEARVRRMTDRFFVVCGYGQSGRRLSEAFDEIGYGTVIIESNPERARAHLLIDSQQASVLLVADARSPDVLVAAGVRMPNCAGLVGLARDDDVNQAIVFGTRVLAPQLPVLARVKSHLAQETLQAFGGVQIVNPFETFAFNFGTALRQPDTLRLEDWLSSAPGTRPPPRIQPPRGHWIVVGYGRFGRAIAAALEHAGLTHKAIDVDPAACGVEAIIGSGLTEGALRDAGIAEAVGIVVATNDDARNLAVVATARRLKRKLFVVIRQNLVGNRSLIEAARADMEFVQAALMARECVQVLTTPLLNRFLLLAREQTNVWAQGVAGRLVDQVSEAVPYLWSVNCDIAELGARHALIEKPEPRLSLAHLLADPDGRHQRLPAVPLLLVRA
ncbi:MAG TPA: NAD-binding protein, partial [Burkholderiaceae bacterium]|nr:NAD-binding protein [Burkholderiaceae bacterium]